MQGSESDGGLVGRKMNFFTISNLVSGFLIFFDPFILFEQVEEAIFSFEKILLQARFWIFLEPIFPI
jgi:hypothetical protein